MAGLRTPVPRSWLSPMAPRVQVVVLLVGLMCVARSVTLSAQDRLSRRYAAGQGLHAAPIAALEQDARGFLWIGGQDGLFRYDGTEFRRWAEADVQGVVHAIAADTGQRLVALTEAGELFQITGEEAHLVAVPLPSGPGKPDAIGFDRRGWLWIVRGGRVAFLDREAGWRIFAAGAFGGEEPRFLHSAPDGEMAVATRRGVWATDSGAVTAKLIEAYEPVDFAFLSDGIAALDTVIREVRNGRVAYHQPRLEIRSRPIALAVRGTTLWASYDRYLVALRPNRSPEVLGPNHGVESGGPLLVDHEGSLWLGTFTALLQYPEPETRIWNERSGLRSQHTRFVGRSGNALWVTTWQGTGLIHTGERGPTARWVDEWFSQQDVCEDQDGGIWLAGRNEIFHVVGERVVSRHPAEFASSLRCGRDPTGGGTWLAVSDSLFHTDARRRLRAVEAPPLPDRARPILALLHDAQSRLWIGGDRIICRGEVVGRTIPRWQCTEVTGTGLILAFAETPSGAIWAASSQAGVLREEDGGWTEVAGNRMLPTRSLVNLIPSPAGGIWVLGHGVVWRVREGQEAQGPWEVLERLGEWHGLPVESGRDLVEDSDETLWITTSLGLIEVPAIARKAPEQPPPVALVEALADGEMLDVRESIELPYSRNRLELRFAVLSFRDPARLRYQVRLGATDPWQSAEGRPWFRWMDLQSRSHRAELRASLDGSRWTRAPASLAFRIRPPWYRTPWSIGLFALAGGLALWLGYRARVRYLLGLEQQRTRIAMDLHDEMGSGLGSIGILSGLLMTRGPQDDAGRDLARRIGTTAEDLGHALSNIIWSLDARPATLGELASRLADAGMNLLAAQGIAFRIVFPDRWPSDRLSATERQDLLLIGLEALHNAARHSRARNVQLAICGVGRRWELMVTDDGVGFDPADKPNGGGHGLGTIRRRAGEIGASIEWKTRPGQGTAVVLRFTLGSSSARYRWARIRRPARNPSPTGFTNGPPPDQQDPGAA